MDDPRAELIAERDYLSNEIKLLQDKIMKRSSSAAVLAEPLANLADQLATVETKLAETAGERVAPTKEYRKDLATMARGDG